MTLTIKLTPKIKNVIETHGLTLKKFDEMGLPGPNNYMLYYDIKDRSPYVDVSPVVTNYEETPYCKYGQPSYNHDYNILFRSDDKVDFFLYGHKDDLCAFANNLFEATRLSDQIIKNILSKGDINYYSFLKAKFS